MPKKVRVSISEEYLESIPYDEKILSEPLKLKAQIELNESDDNRAQCLQKLRSLVEKEGIPCERHDDFLIMFLRCKKFKVKNALEQIRANSYFRHTMMQYYGFMFYDNFKIVLEKNVIGVLPQRDKNGCAVLYFRASNWCEEDCDADTVVRSLQAVVYYVIQSTVTQVCGINLIVDASVPNLQVMKLVVKYARWALPTLHGFPARFRRIDMINCNLIVRTFVNMLTPIIPSKLLKRTKFHGSSYDELYKHYDRSHFPDEFGGTLGPIYNLQEKFLPKFQAYVPTLQATNMYYKRKDTVTFPETVN